MLSSMTPPFPPSTLPWREIGRSSSGDLSDWITWIAPMGDDGDALYCLLVLADGDITVSISRYGGHGSETPTIHRARHKLPQDRQEAAKRVHALLRVADEVAARTVQSARDAERAAAERRHIASRRRTGAPRDGGQDAASARHIPEHRLRERAYFLWEQEGRPAGRAEEFWQRALRELARVDDSGARPN